MADILIRKDRQAGRITLARPQALNALNHEMVLALDAALVAWRDDPEVALVIIDAEGDRAFCSGGDISAVYRAALAGDHELGREFFRDEYRMNARIAQYPKPVVALMQGFTMGGGVGVGGHASHRIVCDSSRVAMPETGIGLIPDVGGSWLLGHAPGRIGEYLGLTAGRMGPGDAIFAGFADTFLPQSQWPDLIDRLAASGNPREIHGETPPESALERMDLSAFGGRNLAEIIAAVEASGDAEALAALRRNSPLSMVATLALVRAARADLTVCDSLAREFRYTYRATTQTDFLEGVRAQLIDKDRNPNWSAPHDEARMRALLEPLGDADLKWEDGK